MIGEPVRENYRRQGELRAVEKMLSLINEVYTANSTGYLVFLDDLCDVLSEHGTVVSADNVGKLHLVKINPKGL